MVQISLMDSYLETVAGYVLDEDKLVTYKWLSKELEVHVNIAKVILWNYWEKYKNKDLVATFMLIGYLKSGGMRVEVVRDTDLAKAKEKFEKIISEHIYSVQKTLTSIELLAGSGEGDSRFSAIKRIENALLSDEELMKMRWGEASRAVNTTDDKKNTLDEKKSALVEKKNIFDKKKNSSTEKKDDSAVEKNLVEKKPPATTSKNEDDMCSNIDKESSKTKTKIEEKPVKKLSPGEKTKGEKKGSTAKKPVQSTKTGFGNLFGKVINQQKIQNNSSGGNKVEPEKSKKSPEEKSLPTKEVKPEKSEVKKKEEPPGSSEKNTKEDEKSKTVLNSTKSSEKKEKTVVPATKKQSTGKKKQKIIRGTKRERSAEDSESEKKKRKRIVVASDSSEDSVDPSDEEDMFVSPPDEESPKVKERSPSPPLSKREGNKRKIRKMVDSTFVDDRGYLITKKSYVYETCSEEEEPEVAEPKKKLEPEVPEEIKTIVKKKQTTLMNFFKKA